MQRHLLPDEIDQLLDGELGFETAPLNAHVRSCDQCRSQLESARQLVRELEHLPHLRPSLGFGDRVMSRVQVFVPWHVALTDWARSLVPRSRAWRVAAGVGFATAGVVLSTLTIFALTRLDAVLFVSEMVWDRLRAGAMELLSAAVGAVLGQGAAEAFRASGAVGVGALFGALGVATLVGLGTVRAIAARSRAE